MPLSRAADVKASLTGDAAPGVPAERTKRVIQESRSMGSSAGTRAGITGNGWCDWSQGWN